MTTTVPSEATRDPNDRGYEACTLLDKIHGEMRFLTVAVTEVIDDDQLAGGCNSLLDRITDDLERLSSEWWDLLQFLPRPPAPAAQPRPPLTPEEGAIKVQLEALADRLLAIQEERQAIPQEEAAHG